MCVAGGQDTYIRCSSLAGGGARRKVCEFGNRERVTRSVS